MNILPHNRNEFCDFMHEYAANRAINAHFSAESKSISRDFLNENAKKALDHFDQSNDFLFPRIKYRTSIGTALTRCCKRAGIKQGNWGTHVLRHTYASHLAMAGVDLASIQSVMGHADIKTTMRYIHLSPDHLKNVTTAINL